MRRIIGLLLACLIGSASLPASAQTFGYDELGRVTSVSYADGSKVLYQYDLVGNRTQVTRTPPAPGAGNVSLSVAYNTAGTVMLMPTGSYTSLSVVTAPAHGTASISGTTATYSPTSGYYGSDSFTYKATGAGGSSSTATVTVTVGNPPAPTVSAKSLSVAYNTAGTVSLTPSGVYTSVSTVTAPAHGTVSISGTTGTYTPTSGYYGSDSFTYKATGPGGTSSAATVSVTVATPAAPTVSAKSLTVAYNTAGTVSLTPSGAYTSVATATNPAHGTVSISGTTATYTPTSGYYGSDSFTYNATGPGGTSANATVSVTVSAPAAPTVSAKSLTVAYNTAGTVSLTPSGVYTSVSTATNPSHGTVSVSGTTATYTPTTGYYGADSFTYKATGPGGTSSPATVSVTVGNPPAPTVSAKSLTVAYNTAGTVSLTPTGVYTSVATATNPAHGTVSISGTTATYTPTTGYYGADSFTYTATGPGGTSTAATVSVTVGNPPAPTVSNKTLAVNTATAGTVNLAPSGVWTSASLVANASHGTASVNASTGVATYTSVAGYSGSDSFTFKATGPGGTSGTGTVSVTVSAINHPPVCADKTVTGSWPGTPATVTIFALAAQAQCTDADGDTLTFSPAVPYSFQINIGETVNINFTASDGHGGSDTFKMTYTRVSPGGL